MSAITQARVDAREVVCCVDCDLVQFVTLAGSCQRCHKAYVYPFDSSVEEPPPVPADPAPQDREEVLAPALVDGWRTPKVLLQAELHLPLPHPKNDQVISPSLIYGTR